MSEWASPALLCHHGTVHTLPMTEVSIVWGDHHKREAKEKHCRKISGGGGLPACLSFLHESECFKNCAEARSAALASFVVSSCHLSTELDSSGSFILQAASKHHLSSTSHQSAISIICAPVSWCAESLVDRAFQSLKLFFLLQSKSSYFINNSKNCRNEWKSIDLGPVRLLLRLIYKLLPIGAALL